MTERQHPDPAERPEITEQDLAIAALVGRYIERREHHETPSVHDLLAAAAEFGDDAVDVLRTVLACYEAISADGDGAHRVRSQGHVPDADSRGAKHASETSPTVVEVLRLENLPLGSRGSRRAVVRWSDGSEGEALAWYADEIQIDEHDLIGKTREQLRSLHFRRDRDWLQS
jgi:hypothetical protein